ncbi:MAG: hypothetical protein GX634_01555 [Lentisphaerae bacterium]|nr:hypothetical protein [Lentisphaerota bacterium]
MEQGQNRANHQFLGGLVLGTQFPLKGICHDVGRDPLPAIRLHFDQIGHRGVVFLRQLNQAALSFDQQGLQGGFRNIGGGRFRRRIEHVRPMLFQVVGGLNRITRIHDHVIAPGHLVHCAGEGIDAARLQGLKLVADVGRNPHRAGGFQDHLPVFRAPQALGATIRRRFQYIGKQNGPGPGILGATHQGFGLDLGIGIDGR